MAQLKDHEIIQNRGKRKTAFTRLTKPNEIAVSLLDIPLDLALADNNSNKFKLQTTDWIQHLKMSTVFNIIPNIRNIWYLERDPL